jgi:hypothetical protein
MLQLERSFSEKSDTNYKIAAFKSHSVQWHLRYQLKRSFSVQQNIYAKTAEIRTGVLVANTVERVGHLKMRPKFFHMAVGSFFAAAILLAHFRLFRLLDVSALVAVSFFNLLFVFLLFPLEGTLPQTCVTLCRKQCRRPVVYYPVILCRRFFLSECRQFQDNNSSCQASPRFCGDSVHLVT